MCVLWALRLQPLPKVSAADLRALAPVGGRVVVSLCLRMLSLLLWLLLLLWSQAAFAGD
jgi:hypothetical protein